MFFSNMFDFNDGMAFIKENFLGLVNKPDQDTYSSIFLKPFKARALALVIIGL